MNKNLLLLTLTALASQGIQAMNRTAIDTEAAAQRAQQFVQSMTTGEQVVHAEPEVIWHGFENTEDSPQASVEQKATAATSQHIENKATTAAFFEQLPYDALAHVKQMFLTDKFIRHAATLDITTPARAQVHGVYTDGYSMMAKLFFYPQKPDKLCVWDMATGKILQETAIDYAHQLSALALTERYQVIAFNKDNIYLQIQDRRTNELVILPISNSWQDRIDEITVSIDELNIAGIDRNGQILIWHREKDTDWKLVYTGKDKGQSPTPKLMFSHNNQLLAIASGQTIQIIDAKAGKELIIFTNNATIAGKNGISSLTFTPDDTCIIVGTHAGVTTVHDITTGELIRALTTQDSKGNEVYIVKTNATGEHIITGHRNGMQRIWDFATGKLLRTAQLDRRIVHYAHTKHTCPFTITRDNSQLTGPIKIHMAPEAFFSLSLEQLKFIRDLIQVRHQQTQKDSTKELILADDQAELFKTLPLFVQTALRTNLNLNTELHEAVNITSMMNTQCGDGTSTALQRLIYEYAKPESI